MIHVPTAQKQSRPHTGSTCIVNAQCIQNNENTFTGFLIPTCLLNLVQSCEMHEINAPRILPLIQYLMGNF